MQSLNVLLMFILVSELLLKKKLQCVTDVNRSHTDHLSGGSRG